MGSHGLTYDDIRAAVSLMGVRGLTSAALLAFAMAMVLASFMGR